MISKNCSLRGQIVINQNKTKFLFYPLSFQRQYSVFYEVYENENEVDQLSLTSKRGDNSQYSTVITLYKNDFMLNKQPLLEISLDTQFFNIEFNKDGETKIERTLQVTGAYKLTSDVGLVDVTFTYNDGITWSLLTNPKTKIHEVHHWLCSVWPPRCKCVDYYMTINDDIVENSDTFEKYMSSNKIIIKVTEKCYVFPLTEDDVPVILGWNNSSRLLKQCLSSKLAVTIETVKLIYKNGNFIEDGVLDIDTFRAPGSEDSPTLYFDVMDKRVRCKSMMNKDLFSEVLILKDAQAEEVKRKLGFKLKTDPMRLVLCQDNSTLSDEDVVCTTEDVLYCVGLSQSNIESKTLLKEGSFGNVYKCVQKSSRETFALKDFKFPSDPETKCSIIRELLFMSSVPPHTNIVKYLDLYVDGSDISVSMEYMSRGSLSSYIVKHKPLEEEDIRRFSQDILAGLHFLHATKTASHRDIKADNVLLAEDFTAKLCDFGLSKLLTDIRNTQMYKEWSQTGECGTKRWMAPEVIEGAQYGLSADIWSFGATVIEMISGDVPFPHLTENQALFEITATRTIEFEKPRPISSHLQDLVESCIRPIPSERPKAAELIHSPFFRDNTSSDHYVS